MAASPYQVIILCVCAYHFSQWLLCIKVQLYIEPNHANNLIK